MIRDRWLTYRMATLECIPKYIETGHATYASITVPCPPRYHQTWSMNVESKDVDANKLKEIESFLASHLDKYFMPTCVFSTVKPEHKRATGIADSDEVAEFVSKCKQVFASTSGRELLREAGKRAGLSDKGSFTIVWRHTDNRQQLPTGHSFQPGVSQIINLIAEKSIVLSETSSCPTALQAE